MKRSMRPGSEPVSEGKAQGTDSRNETCARQGPGAHKVVVWRLWWLIGVLGRVVVTGWE